MDRRGFLGTILALGIAPAVVRASSLMPIKAIEPLIVLPETRPILTVAMIAQEALKVLEMDLVLNDLLIYGVAYQKDGVRIDPLKIRRLNAF